MLKLLLLKQLDSELEEQFDAMLENISQKDGEAHSFIPCSLQLLLDICGVILNCDDSCCWLPTRVVMNIHGSYRESLFDMV